MGLTSHLALEYKGLSSALYKAKFQCVNRSIKKRKEKKRKENCSEHEKVKELLGT